MTKPLAYTDIRASLDKFVLRWQDAGGERGESQPFWIDLLGCFGIEQRRVTVFEKDAKRASTGEKGWIDVFWPGLMIGEQKSAGKSLAAAEAQALDYLSGGSISKHEFPRFVVTCNFENFRVTDLEAPAGHQETVEFKLSELPEHVMDLGFLAGYETVSKKAERDASIDASRVMARLFTAMVGDEVDEPVGDEAVDDSDERTQHASVFLTRLLFLLYGDDAGLWRPDLFYEFVLNHTSEDGSDLGGQLATLFDVLNMPDNRRRKIPDEFAVFPYVNGSLFKDRVPIEFFDRELREALLDACRFRWTRISPAVFGSMFQLVKSKAARRESGEHYTSERNILKTLTPLFLDGLKAEAHRLIHAKSTSVKSLRDFRDRLAEITFLDPACGCGNFLVVAYRELRTIETAIIVEIRNREHQIGSALDATWETKLTIDQFHGFELHWWPAKIAETAMFLVDHQANRELAAAIGQAPDRLPITITAHIHHVNALRVHWDDLIPMSKGPTYVFGNPPFAGHDKRTAEQAADLTHAWGGQRVGHLDFVTAWYVKTLEWLANRVGEWALVATNSVSQGRQPPTLHKRIQDEHWRIKFAHRTFEWDSDAPGKANVHCVITGYTRDFQTKARLFDYGSVKSEPIEVPVSRLNAYLVDGPDVLVTERSTPISPTLDPINFGSMPNDGGHLLVDPDEYELVANDPIAAKYLRPVRGSKEVLNGLSRWCLWLVDASPTEIQASAVLRNRVEKVRQYRLASSRQTTKELATTPHLFAERRQPLTDYLCLPKLATNARNYYVATRLDANTIATDLVFTTQDSTGLMFALASSSMHYTWLRTVGGRYKSDPRFTARPVWNTFPVPELGETTRKTIIEAGQAVVAARARHCNWTLAETYSPLATDPAVVKAHDVLDGLVDRVFGASRRLTSEKARLELLLAAYVKLAARE